jgi:topoisomerase-4 subunit A
LVSTDWKPIVEIIFKSGKDLIKNNINVHDYITTKGIKAIGNQLSKKQLKEINLLDPIPFKPEIKQLNEIEVIEELDQKDNNNSDESNQSQIKLDF